VSRCVVPALSARYKLHSGQLHPRSLASVRSHQTGARALTYGPRAYIRLMRDRYAGMGAKLVYATMQRRAFRSVSCSYSGSLDSRCRRVGAPHMCRRETSPAAWRKRWSRTVDGSGLIVDYHERTMRDTSARNISLVLSIFMPDRFVALQHICRDQSSM